MGLFDFVRRGSKYLTLQASKHANNAIPLCWAATTPERPLANLGDALSPVLLSAFSGKPVVHAAFDSIASRYVSVGSIAHQVSNGEVHLWGSGAGKLRKPVAEYSDLLANTKFHFHALRGPFSAITFRKLGLEVPDIYGDPVWFLPSLIEPAPEKQYELGVIVHISELTDMTATGVLKPHFVRYHIPEAFASSIRIITTFTDPSYQGLEDKIKEITSCKRIASTSLHGLLIAETYGIPNVYFRTRGKRGVLFPEVADETDYMDYRMRDYYSCVGYEKVFVYGQPRTEATDWEALIQALDTHWQPVHWDPEPMLNAFPLPLKFNPMKEKFAGDRSLFEQIKF